MKPLTVALLLGIAATGVACSDTVKSKAEATPVPAGEDPLPVDTSTATSETELGGTLNLNIGGSAQQDSSSRLLGTGNSSGVVLGSGGLGGGNFGEGPDLGIDLEEEEDPSSLLSQPATGAPATSEEDDIVRLPN